MAKLSALSDQELLGLLRSDDGAALGEIYERYHQPLYRFLRKYLRSDELAEDICQNVFIKFWDQRHELTLIRELSAWLFTMAKRMALDFLRSSAMEAAAMGTIVAAYPKNGSIADDLIAKDYLHFIEDVLARLPEPTQQIFRLCRQQHKSYDEAAEILGISRNTVKKHMVRSMKILGEAAQTELGISLSVLFAVLFSNR